MFIRKVALRATVRDWAGIHGVPHAVEQRLCRRRRWRGRVCTAFRTLERMAFADASSVKLSWGNKTQCNGSLSYELTMVNFRDCKPRKTLGYMRRVCLARPSRLARSVCLARQAGLTMPSCLARPACLATPSRLARSVGTAAIRPCRVVPPYGKGPMWASRPECIVLGFLGIGDSQSREGR